MHIPNGFLTDPVCAVSTVSSLAALGVGFSRLRRMDAVRSAPLMAAAGAGIFAAQMVNFPVGGGTSGHLIGATLAAVLLGPARGMLTMASVLAVQCLLFGDGGASALGANILNMAVAGTLVAWVLYRATTRYVAGAQGQLLAAGVAAFGSVMASAALCAVELAASGRFGFAEVLSAMLSVHAAIGLSEAMITVAILAAVRATSTNKRFASARGVLLCGLLLAIGVAGLLAPLASTAPDGLERVAMDLRFANSAADSWAIAPDYAAPGVVWPMLAIALSGIAGVVTVLVVTYTVGRTATARVRKY
jgi:cobalt/nickel transport system permease protein